jgi:hypothetical protein
MRPYAERFMVWNGPKRRNGFAALWKLDEAQIAAVDGKDMGRLQI